MMSSRPLDKDLYALRHRAQELSKGIGKTMQQLTQNKSDWRNVLNELSVVSSQLINIQNDIEKGVGAQLNKFTLQPSHAHFNCESIGCKKMPQIVNDTNRYYTDNSNTFIKQYDEPELVQRLNHYNKMLPHLDQFNAIRIAHTKSNDQDNEEDEEGDQKNERNDSKNGKNEEKK
eukprot:508053_1